MNDVNEAFDAYWKTHFEKLVLPINFKKEMKKIANEKSGFIEINWCGDVACEDKIKDELGLKSRCIPNEDHEPTGKCAVCGRDGKCRIYFGKQY